MYYRMESFPNYFFLWLSIITCWMLCLFFFFFGFHNSVLPLCAFGCPSLSCMIGLLFSPIVFGTCPLKPAFSLGTSALSFGNKTVQIPNCYPVVSVHRHLWFSLCSRQIKFCFLFDLVPDILLNHYEYLWTLPYHRWYIQLILLWIHKSFLPSFCFHLIHCLWFLFSEKT